jgi:hypothetical protein
MTSDDDVPHGFVRAAAVATHPLRLKSADRETFTYSPARSGDPMLPMSPLWAGWEVAMRYVLGLICVLALGLMGCSDEGLMCSPVTNATLSCICPTGGGSCFLECDEDIEHCGLACNPSWSEEIREQPCTVEAAHSCNMLCQSGVDCSATCGDDSLIACQFTKGRCEASVGDNADVRCESAEFCDIECLGSCWVGCWDGNCRVRCTNPEECLVICSKTEEATLCPDGETKVCAMECPGETPT